MRFLSILYLLKIIKKLNPLFLKKPKMKYLNQLPSPLLYQNKEKASYSMNLPKRKNLPQRRSMNYTKIIKIIRNGWNVSDLWRTIFQDTWLRDFPRCLKKFKVNWIIMQGFRVSLILWMIVSESLQLIMLKNRVIKII